VATIAVWLRQVEQVIPQLIADISRGMAASAETGRLVLSVFFPLLFCILYAILPLILLCRPSPFPFSFKDGAGHSTSQGLPVMIFCQLAWIQWW
jgi:hypothetical protein